MHLASSRRPAIASHGYTAIQRYTVYMLYIIPLMAPRQVTVKTAARRIVAMSSTEAEGGRWNSMRPVGRFSWGGAWRRCPPWV